MNKLKFSCFLITFFFLSFVNADELKSDSSELSFNHKNFVWSEEFAFEQYISVTAKYKEITEKNTRGIKYNFFIDCKINEVIIPINLENRKLPNEAESMLIQKYC